MPHATQVAKLSPNYSRTEDPSEGAPPSAPVVTEPPAGPSQGIFLRVVVLGLLGLLIYFNYQIWMSDQGFGKVQLLQTAVREQAAENAALTERNSALEAEVKSLKQGMEAIEEMARTEMGMIRRDETFYHILEEPPPSPPKP